MKSPDIKKKTAIDIVKRLRNAGFKALFAGGAVRDMVMGIEPKDYDIVTDASLHDIEQLFKNVHPVGSQFGVCLVVENKNAFEIAVFRKDGVYEDGRRPISIEQADPAEDAGRRDFTINALFYDPEKDTILDYAGGKRDIHNRVIRAVGDPFKRFEEDKLRILRAVRFAARLSFTIDPATSAALKETASSVIDVSAERIGEELTKMFAGPNSGKALTLLDEHGILEAVLPEVSALKVVEQPPLYHPEGDVFEHTRLMLEMFDSGTETLALGILFHDIAKPATFTRTDRIRFSRHEKIGEDTAVRIMKRLRLRSEVISQVRRLVRNHMRFVNVREMRRSKLIRFITGEGFDELLELHRLDCLASHGKLENYEFIKKVIEEEMQKNRSLALPPPLLTGKDLTELGYEPGPNFGVILKKVEDMRLDGEIASRGEAIDFVQRTFVLPENRQSRTRKNNPPD